MSVQPHTSRWEYIFMSSCRESPFNIIHFTTYFLSWCPCSVMANICPVKSKCGKYWEEMWSINLLPSMKYRRIQIRSCSWNPALSSALKLLAHFSPCYKFVSLMGHFVDVFLFKCFNRSRHSIDPKKFSSVFHFLDENHTFNVFGMKWWVLLFNSSREENSLPAELCCLWPPGPSQGQARSAAGNISGHQNLR